MVSVSEVRSHYCLIFFFNLRVFIKEEPQQEGRETLTSNDTKIAAIKHCLSKQFRLHELVEFRVNLNSLSRGGHI